MMNLPLNYINILYKIAEDREKAERKRREEEEAQGKTPAMSRREAEELQDQLEGF